MRTIDVCVVGAGPAGCFAALHLAQAGFEVLVLEEHAVIGEPVDCSGVVGAEAFEVLGLPRVSVVDELREIELVSPSGLRLFFRPDKALAYLVDRATFDQSLAALAQQAGTTIHTQASVTDLQVTGDTVVIHLTSQSRKETVRAKAVIIAGGPRYRFQQQLGMGRPSRYLKTVQAEVPLPCWEHPKVYFGRSVAPGSFAWFLPVRHGASCRVKVGVSATQDASPSFDRFIADLERAGHLQTNGSVPRNWMIPIEPIPRTYAAHVLAVGDAAGQTKPTTGGGLYYGLLCARIAAETLCEGLRDGELSARRLAQYEHRWRALLGRELQTALWFRRLIEGLSDQGLDGLFKLVQQNGFMQLVERRANFDWHRDLILGVSRKPRFVVALAQGLLRSCLPA